MPRRVQELVAAIGRLHRRWRVWVAAISVGGGLLGVGLMTDPALSAGARAALGTFLWLCVAVFTLQLALRLHRARRHGNLRGYLASMTGIADVLAVVAVPLTLLVEEPAHEAWLAGLIWVLKLAPASAGMRRLSRVVAIEREPLLGVACLFVMVLVLAAGALFALERDVQPAFETLPKALWWAVVTLTTTGYGDVVPQTQAGRVVAGLVMICGLIVLGLWIGIMATGFAVESRRQGFLTNWELVMQFPLFRELDAPSIAELARVLRRLDVMENAAVYDQGDEADSIYFIISGRVEIDLEPTPVVLGPGDFFGEMSLLRGQNRSTTVMAQRPSTLLVLDVMDFRTFTAHHPELAALIEARARERAELYLG